MGVSGFDPVENQGENHEIVWNYAVVHAAHVLGQETRAPRASAVLTGDKFASILPSGASRCEAGDWCTSLQETRR